MSLMLLLITIINTQTRSPGSLAVAATVLTADHTAAAPQRGVEHLAQGHLDGG